MAGGLNRGSSGTLGTELPNSGCQRLCALECLEAAVELSRAVGSSLDRHASRSPYCWL